MSETSWSLEISGDLKLTTFSRGLASLLAEVNEVSGNGHLCFDIAELAPDTEEQVVLLLEGASVLISVANLAFRSLLVGVGDFGEWCKPEQNDKQTDKTGNTQIGPLEIFQTSTGVDSVGREDARGQEGSNEGFTTLYGLTEVQSDFAVLRRTADGEEAINGT